MKRPSRLVLLLLAAGFVTACSQEKPATTARNRFGFSPAPGSNASGTQVLNPAPQSGASSSTAPASTNTGSTAYSDDRDLVEEVSSSPAPMPTPTPPPPPVSVPKPEISYGIPVPGKQGFVTSPHSPNAGFVDVRGFPPGTEVKDPYTGKIFIVP